LRLNTLNTGNGVRQVKIALPPQFPGRAHKLRPIEGIEKADPRKLFQASGRGRSLFPTKGKCLVAIFNFVPLKKDFLIWRGY